MMRGFLICLFSFYSSAVFGLSKDIVWTGNEESLTIGDQIYIFKDETNSRKIDWIASSEPEFIASDRKIVVFNNSNHYWMKFSIKNTSDDQLILNLAQPLLKNVELYYKDSNTGNWNTVLSGYERSIKLKPFKHAYQIFKLPDNITTFYIKFQSNSFSIPVILWEEGHFEDKIIIERLVFGVFTGLMLFAILLNVFFFFSFRKRAYLHYAIMVSLFYATAICVEGYMVLLFPKFDLMYGIAIFSAINMPIGTAYGLLFLNAKRYSPKFYNFGIVLILYYILFLGFHFFLTPLELHVMTSIGGLLNVAFTVLLAFSIWHRGNRLGYYYFMIYTVFFLIAIIDSVNRFTGFPPSIYELTYISIAFLFEAFALAYLLAKRFYWERNEILEAKIKADRELLTQMKENERIVKNQNLILENKVVERTKELLLEKQKSDELLLNILPFEVAEELKSTGRFKTRKYKSISVLFVDIVGFTKLSEQQTGEEIVSELDDCFREFDRITKKHNLEKIKTIGDCYMCAAGLPIEYPKHAIKAVRAAREMMEYINQIKLEKKRKKQPFFEIRAGINSGPVIAGVVGTDKFAYDIWGDTVNIASRIEQNSKPGMINIGENTYQLIKDDYEVEYRGKINAKNMGELDMYFVLGDKVSNFRSGTKN